MTSATIYEEDYLDAGIEHKIEVFARFYPASDDECADWEIIETYINDEKAEIEDIADKLYFFDYKTDTERKMTKRELEYRLITALNDAPN